MEHVHSSNERALRPPEFPTIAFRWHVSYFNGDARTLFFFQLDGQLAGNIMVLHIAFGDR